MGKEVTRMNSLLTGTKALVEQLDRTKTQTSGEMYI